MEKKKRERNLVGQGRNGLLESITDALKSLNRVSHMRINDALGANGNLVSIAVGVDLVLGMTRAIDDPLRGRRSSRSFFLEGLVNGDELMLGRELRHQMDPLAAAAKEYRADFAVLGGVFLLAALAPDIIRVHRIVSRRRDHTGGEVIGGEIRSSLGHRERTMALGASWPAHENIY